MFHASLEIICEGITKAWNEIKFEILKNIFEKLWNIDQSKWI